MVRVAGLIRHLWRAKATYKNNTVTWRKLGEVALANWEASFPFELCPSQPLPNTNLKTWKYNRHRTIRWDPPPNHPGPCTRRGTCVASLPAVPAPGQRLRPEVELCRRPQHLDFTFELPQDTNKALSAVTSMLQALDAAGTVSAFLPSFF